MKLDLNALSQAMKAHRGDASQHTVSAEVGIAQGTYSRYENGLVLVPKLETVAAICDWLDEPIAAFMTAPATAAA